MRNNPLFCRVTAVSGSQVAASFLRAHDALLPEIWRKAAVRKQHSCLYCGERTSEASRTSEATATVKAPTTTPPREQSGDRSAHPALPSSVMTRTNLLSRMPDPARSLVS